MLSGTITYYNHKSAKLIIEHHWNKKTCQQIIESYKRKGFTLGAKVKYHHNKDPLEIVGFVDIPENGYKWTNYRPSLLKCKSSMGYISHYRYDELTLQGN